MNIFKKTEIKKPARSALRPLSPNEAAAVAGAGPLVCPVGTHHANGGCVKN